MRRSAWAVVLGLLVVLDAVLVWWALRPADQAGAGFVAPSTSSTAGEISAPGSTSRPATGADRVVVVPISATAAWRIVTGATCTTGSPATVRISSSGDSGASWKDGPTTDLRVVSSVSTDAAGTPVLSGLDSACKATTVQLTKSGTAATREKPQWAVDPRDASTLLRSGQATAKACPSGAVLDLAPDSAARVNVLCDGGVVRRSLDSGVSWTTVGTVKGATGIATASARQGYRVYVASSQDCGIRVAALVDEAAGSATGCVDSSLGARSADIAIWGSSVWVADQAKGWVVPTGSGGGAGAASPSSTSTAR